MWDVPARRSVVLLVWSVLVVSLGLLGLAAAPASAAPAPPTVTLIDDQNTTLPGDPFAGVEFAAQSAEYYDVGNPQSTAWVCSVDFGDGTPASGYWRSRFSPAPCAQFHTYARPGSYTITMTVTDATGASTATSRIVVVTAAQVTPVDGGVEGNSVRLTAPAGSSSYAWTASDRGHCTIASPTARRTGVTCDDEGTFAFEVRGDSNATTGEYDVTYVNGAPQPVLQPVRYHANPRTQDGHDVVSPRVGTGDSLQWRVRAHDPSWRLAGAGLLGDTLSCHFDFGDGTTGDDADRTFDGCLGFHVYTEPGVYRTRVTVTDDSGATGTATARVRVVRRDVHVAAYGHQGDGLRGRVVGRLTPRGVHGHMSFNTPEGHRVVVADVDRIQVDNSQVQLQGLATVDGQPGYFVFADVLRAGGDVVRLQVDQGDRDDPNGTWTIVENATGQEPEWRREYQAPMVR